VTVRFLTVEEVLTIHRLLIEEFGGLHGIRDQNMLEAALMRPQMGYYDSLIEQAAALMESLANNHAFIDGNKRVAFFVTDTFLRLNGYWIDQNNEETYVYFMQLFANNRFRFSELRTWLNEHVKLADDNAC
jgi:death-on-curing protein